jgi:DNA-binding XRE family transcriptional regulator
VNRGGRPKRALVNFRELEYEMDVAVCRAALVRRQVEGEIGSIEGLAQAVGCSRSTVSRLFAGRQTSLTVALRILDKLKLTFDEVFTRRAAVDRDGGPPGRTAVVGTL